jgi:hypothetical protein
VLLFFLTLRRSDGAVKNVRILLPVMLGYLREMSMYEEELELKLGLGGARSLRILSGSSKNSGRDCRDDGKGRVGDLRRRSDMLSVVLKVVYFEN